jgi:hypothetical protein
MRPKETVEMMIRACTGACLAIIGLLQPIPAQCQNAWTLNPPPLFPTNEWGPVANDCQLGLRFPKLEYQAGEQILAAIALRNVGDRQLGHIFFGPDLNYEVIVKNTDGHGVPYTESWASIIDKAGLGAIGGSAHSEQLAPHQQQYSCWVDVTKRYKIDQPGMYTVTVKDRTGITQAASQEAHATNLVTTVDMFSNPVTITIVAPSAAKPEK